MTAETLTVTVEQRHVDAALAAERAEAPSRRSATCPLAQALTEQHPPGDDHFWSTGSRLADVEYLPGSEKDKTWYGSTVRQYAVDRHGTRVVEAFDAHQRVPVGVTVTLTRTKAYGNT